MRYKQLGGTGRLVSDIRLGTSASLRRLGTECTDLHQIHGFDPITPDQGTVQALEDLVRLGHMRDVGL
jgi:aryl-alcohol dehydrogenase-like predicted oxidoreductase